MSPKDTRRATRDETPATLSGEERRALRAMCDRSIQDHGIRTVPDVVAAVTAGIRRLATERRLWAFGGSQPVATPGIRVLELTIGDASLGFTADEVADVVRELLPRD